MTAGVGADNEESPEPGRGSSFFGGDGLNGVRPMSDVCKDVVAKEPGPVLKMDCVNEAVEKGGCRKVFGGGVGAPSSRDFLS